MLAMSPLLAAQLPAMPWPWCYPVTSLGPRVMALSSGSMPAASPDLHGQCCTLRSLPESVCLPPAHPAAPTLPWGGFLISRYSLFSTSLSSPELSIVPVSAVQAMPGQLSHPLPTTGSSMQAWQSRDSSSWAAFGRLQTACNTLKSMSCHPGWETLG